MSLGYFYFSARRREALHGPVMESAKATFHPEAEIRDYYNPYESPVCQGAKVS